MGNRLGFGLGTLGRDALAAMVSMFLMFYLTDVLEISGVQFVAVSVVMVVMRAFDAINDPFMGSSSTTPAPGGASSSRGSCSAPWRGRHKPPDVRRLRRARLGLRGAVHDRVSRLRDLLHHQRHLVLVDVACADRRSGRA
ncbi:hypothetical protein G7085_02320 [Tessaracoccus sp. HDW20]|nr:hypothetical protein [Tessaracoccus coleopterorum]